MNSLLRMVYRTATALAVAASPCPAIAQESALPAALAVDGGRVDAAEDAGERVMRVGLALARASAGQCPSPRMMTGARFVDIASYDEKQRPMVERLSGIGSGFAVYGVADRTPAWRAGLRPGDRILQLNGQDMTRFALGRLPHGASDERVAGFERLLDSALRKGMATLVVRRSRQEEMILLEGEPGCGGVFRVEASDVLNAWADGVRISVTTRMVASARNDDELAFVLAHEMAHNLLGHGEQARPVDLVLSAFGLPAIGMRRAEIEADRHAVVIMARAGYDPLAAIGLLQRLKAARPLDFLSISHPGMDRRMAIVRAAAADLSRPESAGQQLGELAIRDSELPLGHGARTASP